MFGWFAAKKKQEKPADDLRSHVSKKLLDNPLNTFCQSRRFLDAGQRHESEGNYDEAFTCYDVSLKLRKTPAALCGMAGVLMHRGEAGEAKKLLEEARGMACPDDLAALITKRLGELD